MNIRVLIFIICVAIGASSCKHSDVAPVKSNTTVGNLNMVNATNNVLNLYQNGNRVNNASVINPGSVSGYLPVAYGTQKYQLKIAGETNPNYLFDAVELTLDTLKTYSLFAVGETSDKLFLKEDVISSAIPQTQAAIRFVNTLPGTTNLDVKIEALNYTNVSFTTATDFTGIAPGPTTIKVYQAGLSTPDISETFTLVAGTIYTVFTTGTLAGTGTDKLTVKLSIN